MPKLDVSQYALAHALDMAHGTHRMETWHPRLPDHLSATSVAMFQRCPEQFRHRYVLGEKERPAEATTIGSAVHRALERNFVQKMRSHEDLPTAELLDFYDDVAWKLTVTGQEAETEKDILWDTSEEQARVRGRLMTGEYRNLVAPRVQPLAVEQRIELDFGAPVPVQGVYDVETEPEMIDLKTGKRRTSRPKESWKIQGAIYYEYARKPVAFHLVAASGKTVSITTPLEAAELLVAPSEAKRRRMREDMRMIAGTIAFYMTLLGPDEPWPTFGVHHDWACSFCGYRPHCPAWKED